MRSIHFLLQFFFEHKPIVLGNNPFALRFLNRPPRFVARGAHSHARLLAHAPYGFEKLGSSLLGQFRENQTNTLVRGVRLHTKRSALKRFDNGRG